MEHYTKRLLKKMNSSMSSKRQIRLVFSITLLYLCLQILVSIHGDKDLSRLLWLEHKNVKELINAGKPHKSELTAIIKSISDHHFWFLRAGLLSSFILALYYKGRDDNRYIMYKNISLSTIIILILISGILTWSLKILIGKPRPYTNLNYYMPFSFSTRFHSFPSGHTTETFSYIFPYIYFYRKYSISIILIIYGIIISLTRIILSYHYFSDVIFSIYITIISGYIICHYFKKYSAKQYNKRT